MNSRQPDKRSPWFGVLVSVMLSASLASGLAQTDFALASLTIPETDLPAGCRLRPAAPPETKVDGRTIVSWETLYPSNPWSGSDRRLVIALRTSIEPPLRVPDPPPLSAAERSAWERRWVANVVEGYRAVYDSPAQAGGAVSVSAIRFNDPTLATVLPTAIPTSLPPTTPLAILRQRSRPVNDRMVVGAAVVMVQGDSRGACFKAVDGYIRGLT